MKRRWSSVGALAVISTLAGCAVDPAFEQPHGDSVKRMIAAQTYHTGPRPAPATLLYDGERVQRSVQLYRETEVRQTGDRLGEIEPHR